MYLFSSNELMYRKGLVSMLDSISFDIIEYKYTHTNPLTSNELEYIQHDAGYNRLHPNPQSIACVGLKYGTILTYETARWLHAELTTYWTFPIHPATYSNIRVSEIMVSTVLRTKPSVRVIETIPISLWNPDEKDASHILDTTPGFILNQLPNDMSHAIVRRIHDAMTRPSPMNVCYCFIGTLPSYILEQAYQLRLFYDGPAYCILNDVSSPIVKILQDTYKIQIIPYEEVVHTQFLQLIERTGHKFHIAHGLKGREKLFIYSFERFYVLYNLMRKYSLRNVLFLELDNLIYDDPRQWLHSLEHIDIAYLFDNYDRASAGISYIRHADILQTMLGYFTIYIQNDTGFINEMSALYRFYEFMEKKKTARMSFLPIHWKDPAQPPQTYALSNVFKDSIFDALSIGIYLAGIDTYHSMGKIETKKKSPWGLIDYTSYTYEYIYDEKGRKIPYILHEGRRFRINNLHIHSKDLVHHLSKPMPFDK